jgi:hypothetical protein
VKRAELEVRTFLAARHASRAREGLAQWNHYALSRADIGFRALRGNSDKIQTAILSLWDAQNSAKVQP